MILLYTYNDLNYNMKVCLHCYQDMFFDTCTYIIKLTLYWLNFQEYTITVTKYCITNRPHIILPKYHI